MQLIDQATGVPHSLLHHFASYLRAYNFQPAKLFTFYSVSPLLIQISLLTTLQTMAGRRFEGRSAPRPAARPAASAPTPAPVPRGNGFGAAIADGLGWGTGTAIAHRAVDALFGPRVIKHETVASSESAAAAAAPAPNMNSFANSDACGGQSKALSDCLSNYGSDISKCQFYMDMLRECRRSSGAVLGA